MSVARFVATLSVLVGAAVEAETLESIAVQGNALSSLYGITEVSEARTPTEEVRVYSMSTGDDFGRETLVLQISAARRPPNMAFDVMLWDLGDVLGSVESVVISNDIVTITGSRNGGQRQCRYAFSFDDGRLSKTLQAINCDSKP